MNENQVKGRANTAKGKTKEVIGEAIDNDELKYKGKAQKLRGRIESAYGDAKDDFSNIKE